MNLIVNHFGTGCQNLIGGYRCGCPEGYVLHYYYNQCVDDNECINSPCGGEGNCFNTPGSYRCGCPDGYQFDNKLQICIQVSVFNRNQQFNAHKTFVYRVYI